MDKERLTRQALRRLEALGYDVSLSPKQEEVSSIRLSPTTNISLRLLLAVP